MSNETAIGRPKIQYDEKEIGEIIELKLKSIGHDYSKLTYNAVFKFNKYLVENKKKNYNNEIFNLYGYAFWATNYKGTPNYGKQQIDLYKQQCEPIVAGEIFKTSVTDIETIIDANQDNPEKLKKILVKLFVQEREKNARNDKAFNTLISEVNKYKSLSDQYKRALFMLFYNSRYSTNSLNDIITLQKEGDTYIRNEILHIFDNNRILIDEIEQMESTKELEETFDCILNDNILDMAKIFEKKNR